MRLSIIVPAAVLVLCAAVLVTAGRERMRAAPRAPDSGMDMLRRYPCIRGESKVVLVKGVEDGFSPAGNEPGFFRPGLDNARWRSMGKGSYDQSEPDRKFFDSLEVPARIRNGLFVIGLRSLAVADSANDSFTIGDLALNIRFGIYVADLHAAPGWKREGGLHYAQLGDIAIDVQPSVRAGSLLDHLRDGAQPHWLDVNVNDDTSVDFIGLAACVPPPPGKGTPFMTDAGQPAAGFVALTCNRGPEDWPICDQYVGDTACETELPVACLLPGRKPAPHEVIASYLGLFWTGGDIALTEPVAAARFRHVAEVDAFCTAHFGQGWRALASHDGMPNLGVAGRGRAPAHMVRAWVDQVDQPYATCWAR